MSMFAKAEKFKYKTNSENEKNVFQQFKAIFNTLGDYK